MSGPCSDPSDCIRPESQSSDAVYKLHTCSRNYRASKIGTILVVPHLGFRV